MKMMKEVRFFDAEIISVPIFNPGLLKKEQGWGIEKWYEILKGILEEAKNFLWQCAASGDILWRRRQKRCGGKTVATGKRVRLRMCRTAA